MSPGANFDPSSLVDKPHGKSVFLTTFGKTNNEAWLPDFLLSRDLSSLAPVEENLKWTEGLKATRLTNPACSASAALVPQLKPSRGVPLSLGWIIRCRLMVVHFRGTTIGRKPPLSWPLFTLGVRSKYLVFALWAGAKSHIPDPGEETCLHRKTVVAGLTASS